MEIKDLRKFQTSSRSFREDFGRGMIGSGMGKSISGIIPLPNIPLPAIALHLDWV